MITKSPTKQRRRPCYRKRRCCSATGYGFSAAASASGPLGDDLVDQAVVLGFIRRKEEVALGVALDLFQRLASAVRKDLVHLRLGLEDVARMDLDVGRLALRSAEHLVDHDFRVGQRKALALGAGCEQE